MTTVNTRQIPSDNEKLDSKALKKHRMPFHLERQPYKQLMVYLKKGHWSEKQKLKYAVFLQYFKERFEIKAKRRFNNIFDLMAIFIKTRNPHQCRSHHQKMEKQKFKIDSILASTSSKYHPRVYQELRQRYINEIETLQIDQEQNFQKFKERIQKIEMQKNIQRQIMVNNKRILRSAKNQEMLKNHKLKRPFETKKHQDKQKSQKLNLHRQDDVIKQQKNPHIQQFKINEQKNFQQRNQKTKYNRPSQSNTTGNYHISVGFPPLGEVDRIPQQKQFYSRMQMMQNLKKHHLDLAYYHYSQYMKNLNEANKLQFQMMNQSTFQTNNQFSVQPNPSIKFMNF